MSVPIVYFDQADWSYLEQRKFPREEARLRLLGARGQARFLVSQAHLLENAGLTSGRQSREEFLRGFPGLCECRESSQMVLSRYGQAVARVAIGLPIQDAVVVVHQVDHLPLAADNLEFVRDVLSWPAMFATLARGIKRHPDGRLARAIAAGDHVAVIAALPQAASREQQAVIQQIVVGARALMNMARKWGVAGDTNVVRRASAASLNRIMVALSKGDADGVLGELRRHSELSRQHEAFVRVVCNLALPFVRIARERGHPVVVGDVIDEAFLTCVVPFLPAEAKQSDAALKATQESWRRNGGLLEGPFDLVTDQEAVWRPFRCYAAVWKEQTMGNGGKINVSALVDRDHAVFAGLPGMAVFTCDKRNAVPLQRQLGAHVKVIKTEHLGEVVDALEARCGE